MVRTKTFRNGGSLAVRIPAGWVDDGELTLSRNPVSGEIVISQRSARLKQLLLELSERDPISDPVFDEALARPIESDDQSVFERQAGKDAAN